MPLPEDSGGWAIHGAELGADANSRFDRNHNGIDLVDKVVSACLYLTRAELRANGVASSEIADWVLRYTARANLRGQAPANWHGDLDQRVFVGALVDAGSGVSTANRDADPPAGVPSLCRAGRLPPAKGALLADSTAPAAAKTLRRLSIKPSPR
jgi:hypothetical protein